MEMVIKPFPYKETFKRKKRKKGKYSEKRSGEILLKNGNESTDVEYEEKEIQ